MGRERESTVFAGSLPYHVAKPIPTFRVDTLRGGGYARSIHGRRHRLWVPNCSGGSSGDHPAARHCPRTHKRRHAAFRSHPPKYDLFLERKAQGNGYFMTRTQIESHVTNRIESLFSNIPGIKVRQSGTAYTIQSQRCGGSTVRSSTIRIGKSNAPGDASEDNLGPLVYVDGQLLGGTSDLAMFRAEDIEAIEVYQGATQVPAEARGRACFAIFLWTRSP